MAYWSRATASTTTVPPTAGTSATRKVTVVRKSGPGAPASRKPISAAPAWMPAVATVATSTETAVRRNSPTSSRNWPGASGALASSQATSLCPSTRKK